MAKAYARYTVKVGSFKGGKAKIFEEYPEAQEEYAALGPQYEVIRAEIESRRTAGIFTEDGAEPGQDT